MPSRMRCREAIMIKSIDADARRFAEELLEDKIAAGISVVASVQELKVGCHV